MEISNTGCRQDNKAEATQAELGPTCMMVSLVTCVCLHVCKRLGEQRGANVCVCISQSGTKRTMAGYVNVVCARVFHHPVWLFGDWLVCACITSLQGGEGVR